MKCCEEIVGILAYLCGECVVEVFGF